MELLDALLELEDAGAVLEESVLVRVGLVVADTDVGVTDVVVDEVANEASGTTVTVYWLTAFGPELATKTSLVAGS